MNATEVNVALRGLVGVNTPGCVGWCCRLRLIPTQSRGETLWANVASSRFLGRRRDNATFRLQPGHVTVKWRTVGLLSVKGTIL